MIKPEDVRSPVALVSTTSFVIMAGITTWALAKGGTGPLLNQGTPSSFQGLSRGWAWFYAITSSVGGISSGILNQADFTRFVPRQGMQIPGNVLAPLVPGIIVPLFGLLTASATMNIYGGEPIWNPLELIIRWMSADYSPISRVAAFTCSVGFMSSQLAENVLANGYAAGMDLAGLFPHWINIRRGALIAALLSWVPRPWLFYHSSSNFIAIMSSFSVFLAPLTGIMMCDYFLVRNQKIELSNLFSDTPNGAYWYQGGINWMAMLTWVFCFIPALPGMLATFNAEIVVSEILMNYYHGNYIFGMSGLIGSCPNKAIPYTGADAG